MMMCFVSMLHFTGVSNSVSHHAVSVLPAWLHSCLPSALQRDQVQVRLQTRAENTHLLCNLMQKVNHYLNFFQAFPPLAGPLDAVQEADGSGCTGPCFAPCHPYIHRSYSLFRQTQNHLGCGEWGTAGWFNSQQCFYNPVHRGTSYWESPYLQCCLSVFLRWRTTKPPRLTLIIQKHGAQTHSMCWESWASSSISC